MALTDEQRIADAAIRLAARNLIIRDFCERYSWWRGVCEWRLKTGQKPPPLSDYFQTVEEPEQGGKS